jgi:hypothetical protein
MNSPRSSIRRNDLQEEKLPIRGHSVARSNNISVDERDDASSVDVRQCNAWSSPSGSSSSVASTSSKTYNAKSAAPKTSSTYADEYLRAALATPNRPNRKAGDSFAPFPSNATLTPSQSSYLSDVGQVYDDPPEITSIPTDEIVDSYTRPTIGEPTEKDGNAESKPEGPEDEKVKVAPRETIARGSRDQYTFGRLQARASKRRELLQQVPEEEDLTNYHSTARASRIKNVRSLYIPPEHVQKPEPSSVSSPNNRSTNSEAAESPTKVSMNSPTNKSMMSSSNPSPVKTRPTASPTNHSVQSKLSTIEHAVSPTNLSTSSGIATALSPSNRSTNNQAEQFATATSPEASPVTSPTNQSVNNTSELATIANSVAASAVTSPASQSFDRKTLASSKSDELSEYRAKLFAKMLHLLDDVEHPGLDANSTKGSRMSHEYSVAELKLIQKRTEEEMSRILNEFRGNTPRAAKGGALERNTGATKAAKLRRESNEDQDCYQSDDEQNPPPGNVMTVGISSKLSDITSPTTCQDGSSVYIDMTGDRYVCVENEDEIAEGSPRNLPPRPGSPRKKKMSVVSPTNGQENLPIVQESTERTAVESPNKGGTKSNVKAGSKMGSNIVNKTESDYMSAEISQSVSPRSQTRDRLLAASRNAARRTVKKEKQRAEDDFYSEIMDSVSAAEADEVERLNAEATAFMATFDTEVDDVPGLMNEDGSINEDVALAFLKVVDEDQQQPNAPTLQQQPNTPTHQHCGAGCVIQ